MWAINYATLSSLRAALASTASISIGLRVDVRRAQSSAAATISQTAELDASQRARLLEIASSAASSQSIGVPHFFPKFVRIPSVASAQPLALVGQYDAWHTAQSLAFTRDARRADAANGTDAEQWWALSQADDDTSPFGTRRGDGLKVVVASDRIAGSGITISLVASGVIAFYAAIVYGLHRVVRSIPALEPRPYPNANPNPFEP